jgi:hypothetical protein
VVLALDLARSSKEKFTLAQGRLRRGLIELTILSLHGSIHDAMRSHLLLRRYEVADAVLPTLLDTLQQHDAALLTPDEAAELQRMHDIWQRIVHGEAVTLTADRATAYMSLVSALLLRYDILVVAPEPRPTPSVPFTPPKRPGVAWPTAGRRNAVLSVVLVLVLVIGVLVVGNMVLFPFTDERMVQTTAPAATAVPEPGSQDDFAPGQAARIRADLDEDTAVYAEPAPSSEVRLYLSPDTAVEILAGPEDADGRTWWQIQAANQSGWVPASVLTAR